MQAIGVSKCGDCKYSKFIKQECGRVANVEDMTGPLEVQVSSTCTCLLVHEREDLHCHPSLTRTVELMNNSEDKDIALKHNSSPMTDKLSNYTYNKVKMFPRSLGAFIRFQANMQAQQNRPGGESALDIQANNVDKPTGQSCDVSMLLHVSQVTASASPGVQQDKPNSGGCEEDEKVCTADDDGPCGEGEKHEDSGSQCGQGRATSDSSATHTLLVPFSDNSTIDKCSNEDTADDRNELDEVSTNTEEDRSPCGQDTVTGTSGEVDETIDTKSSEVSASVNVQQNEHGHLFHSTSESDEKDAHSSFTLSTDGDSVGRNCCSSMASIETEKGPTAESTDKEKGTTMSPSRPSSKSTSICDPAKQWCPCWLHVNPLIPVFIKLLVCLQFALPVSSEVTSANCTLSNVTEILTEQLQNLWNSNKSFYPTDPGQPYGMYFYVLLCSSLVILCLCYLCPYGRSAFSKFFLPVVSFVYEATHPGVAWSISFTLHVHDQGMEYTTTIPSPSEIDHTITASEKSDGIRGTDTFAELSVTASGNAAPRSQNCEENNVKIKIRKSDLTKQPQTPLYNAQMSTESGYGSSIPASQSKIVTPSHSRPLHSKLSTKEASFEDSSGTSFDVSELVASNEPLSTAYEEGTDLVGDCTLTQDWDPGELVCPFGVNKGPAQADRGGRVGEEVTQPNGSHTEIAGLSNNHHPRERSGRHPPNRLNYEPPQNRVDEHHQLPLHVNVECPRAQGLPIVQTAPFRINPEDDFLAFNAYTDEPQCSLAGDSIEVHDVPEYTPALLESSVAQVECDFMSPIALAEADVHMFEPRYSHACPVVAHGDTSPSLPVYPLSMLRTLPPSAATSQPVLPSLPVLPSTETRMVVVPSAYIPTAV